MRFSLSDDHALSLAALGLFGLVLAVTSDGQPHAIGRMSIDTIIVGVPLAILLCLPYVRRKGLGSVPPYLLGPAALGFLTWGLLSVVANGGQFSSLLTMARYASYFVLAIVISVVAQEAPVRRLLLWTIAVTAGLTTLLAFAQFVDPKLTPGMNGISPEISTRVVGTFYNSNFYAEYLLLSVGAIGALFFTEKRRARLVTVLLGVLVIVALLLTYTRGSWIGVAIAVLIFAAAVDVRYLVAVGVLGAAGVLSVPGVVARLSQSAANSGSAEFRLGIWRIAGQAMRTRPLFGYGPGDFLVAYRDVVMTRPEFFQGYLGFGAHNSYFQHAAEIGILGGVLFFAVTAMYATRGFFIAAREGVSQEVKLTALALSAALVGFIANTFTSNTFQHPQSALFFWILAGMVGALGAGMWSADARASESSGEPSVAVVRGSIVVRWALHARDWCIRLWRGSRTFDLTARPVKSREGWFGSSVVMGFVFGKASDRPSRGR